MKKKLILLIFLISNITFSLNNNEVKSLLIESKNHLGTKYVFGAKAGNTNEFDCSSFILYLFRKIGINLPRTSREQVKMGREVGLNELKRGDLLFFSNKGQISHVAMYIGNNQFIHASSGAKKVTITEINNYYRKKIVAIRRIKSNMNDTEIKKTIDKEVKSVKRVNELAFIKR